MMAVSTSISADKATEAEASFREALEDVITVAEGLKRHCDKLDDLIGMARLALENDGMLRILIENSVGQKK